MIENERPMYRPKSPARVIDGSMVHRSSLKFEVLTELIPASTRSSKAPHRCTGLPKPMRDRLSSGPNFR